MDATANLKARLEEKPPEAASYKSDMSPAISKLLAKMLSIYPAERPKSYEEIIDSIVEIQRGIGQKSKSKRPSEASKRPAPGTNTRHIKKQKSASSVKKMSVTQSQVSQVREVSRSGGGGMLMQLIPIILTIIMLILIVSHILGLGWYENTVKKILPSYSDTEETTYNNASN